eukprot:2978149-Rhodomonas_salina.1
MRGATPVPRPTITRGSDASRGSLKLAAFLSITRNVLRSTRLLCAVVCLVGGRAAAVLVVVVGVVVRAVGVVDRAVVVVVVDDDDDVSSFAALLCSRSPGVCCCCCWHSASKYEVQTPLLTAVNPSALRTLCSTTPAAMMTLSRVRAGQDAME